MMHRIASQINQKKNMRLINLTIILLISFYLFGCGKKEPPKPPPLEVPVVEVAQEDVPVILEMVGQTLGSSDIPIRARVDGTLETMEFLEGRSVGKDQLLYTIDTRPFDAKVVEAKGYLAEAKTALAKTKSDLARIRPLAEMNAVSQQDLDAAVANYEAALGALQAAEAQLEQAKIDLSYTKIHSPISGRIGLTRAKVGEYVGKDPNPVILNYVSKIDPIRVRFSINERDYLRFARQFSKKIEEFDDSGDAELRRLKEEELVKGDGNLELILADGTIHKHKGQVVSFEAAIDPTTGTLTLEADFPNPETLVLAGQFARVRAIVEVLNDAILVPQRAVSELQGRFQVMVINQDNMVEVRKVKPGIVHENLRVIEEGLKPGERVATEGLLRLRNDMKVVPKDLESLRKEKEEAEAKAKAETEAKEKAASEDGA